MIFHIVFHVLLLSVHILALLFLCFLGFPAFPTEVSVLLLLGTQVKKSTSFHGSFKTMVNGD